MEDVLDVTGTVGSEDVFDTGSLPVPSATPDAHDVEIQGVDSITFDSGATAIQIHMKSLNLPLDMTKRIFVPKMFVEDIYVDKTTLPEEQGNNQRFSYRSGVQNDDHTADLEVLRAIAAGQGVSAGERGVTRPSTFAEYVDNHNKLLSGVRLIVVRRPGKDDFKNRLEVARFYAPEVKDNPGKKFTNVRLQWEQ